MSYNIDKVFDMKCIRQDINSDTHMWSESFIYDSVKFKFSKTPIARLMVNKDIIYSELFDKSNLYRIDD